MARTNTQTVEARIATEEAQHAQNVMLIRTVAKLEENYRATKASLDEDLKAAIKMAKRDVKNAVTAAATTPVTGDDSDE